MVRVTKWLAKGHQVSKQQIKIQFSHSVVSDSLGPDELQHTRPPCPSPTLRVYPNSCPLSRWCHPTISSSVNPFSSCLQSFPTSGSFQMSQLFASSGQNIGVSASTSVLPVNTQDWFPLGWTGWISLQIKIITLFIWIFSPSSILYATKDLAPPRYWKCTQILILTFKNLWTQLVHNYLI